MCATQALYQMLVTGTEATDLLKQFREDDALKNADAAYFERLMRGALAQRSRLEAAMDGILDRPLEQLDTVEHALLLMAGYELSECPEVPYRVVIDQAVELCKAFGGEDGHRYINGVLDKLAKTFRAAELSA